jgi:hypothetical protein
VDEFVPRDFDVPRRLETPQFVLEPLRPEDNEHDYDAWTSSMDHIAATPAWGDGRWPREMTPDENRADLQRHADDFRKRTGGCSALSACCAFDTGVHRPLDVGRGVAFAGHRRVVAWLVAVNLFG